MGGIRLKRVIILVRGKACHGSYFYDFVRAGLWSQAAILFQSAYNLLSNLVGLDVASVASVRG